ncbi:MAG TPA: ion channel [Pseudomonadales bacterium]|jgi:Ion channel|nr:ion channel [Pseudomonadales bacterium]
MPTHAFVDDITRTRSRLASWKFGQLAVFFLLLLFVLPLLHHGLLVKAISTLFVLNSLLVADSSNPNAHGLRRIGWSLWGIALASNVIEEFHLNQPLTFAMKYLAIGSHALLLLVCAVSILNVVLRASRITLDGIIASVVAYELIGVLFAQIYTLAYVADSTSLLLPGNAPPSTENFQVELIYFSFVTLATLGYGDIVPVTNVTRSVAIVEAVIGQFYVAVIVAVLVSAFVSQRMQDLAEPDDSK